MHVLTLGTSIIHQLDGLYSLNDLHKAAGGEKRHQPSDFLKIDQTKALVEELGNSEDSRSFETARISVVKTITGRNGGTYACRELVIAYAAWISAAFHLKVIRVFLAKVDAAPPNPEQTQQPGLDQDHVLYCMTIAQLFGTAVVNMLFNKFLTHDEDSIQHERFLVSFDARRTPDVQRIERDVVLISAEDRAAASAKLNEACRHLGLTRIALNH